MSSLSNWVIPSAFYEYLWFSCLQSLSDEFGQKISRILIDWHLSYFTQIGPNIQTLIFSTNHLLLRKWIDNISNIFTCPKYHIIGVEAMGNKLDRNQFNIWKSNINIQSNFDPTDFEFLDVFWTYVCYSSMCAKFPVKKHFFVLILSNRLTLLV